MLTEMSTDITFQVLEKALDGSSSRHRVLANNIANVNTPGFKRGEVSFQEELRRALDCANSCRPQFQSDSRISNSDYAGSGEWMNNNSGCSDSGTSPFVGENQSFCFQSRRTNPMHFEFGVPRLEDVTPKFDKFLHLKYRNDESGVDIDREIAEMTKNSLYYNAVSKRVSQKFQMLNTVITKGGQA